MQLPLSRQATYTHSQHLQACQLLQDRGQRCSTLFNNIIAFQVPARTEHVRIQLAGASRPHVSLGLMTDNEPAAAPGPTGEAVQLRADLLLPPGPIAPYLQPYIKCHVAPVVLLAGLAKSTTP